MDRKASLSRHRALIEQTLADGFARLRFPKLLEERYLSHRHALLVPRSVTVAWYAIAIYSAYCISDYLLLPESVHYKTIGIRLFVLVPCIALLICLSRYSWRPRHYVLLYLCAYLAGGLSVISIILLGRMENVVIPYEGLLLLMLFGYFLTGLPFYSMVSASLLLFSIYLLAEWWLGYPAGELVYKAFFMVTANVIGAIGAYIQEHTQRSNYLNKCLVEVSRDEAETLSESKTMLLATASHDLRQPLHAMNLLTENLLHNLPAGQNRDTSLKLNTAIQHLNRLLSALLDYSRLNAGVVEPRLSSVDIVELLTQLKAAVEQDSGVPEITLTLRAAGLGGEGDLRSCLVATDALLLARIVRNIVDNAIEHAQANTLSMELVVHPGRIEMRLTDDGVGMTQAEVACMYQEFYQGGGASGKGMGLGLAIVKQAVDLLDIPMEVASEKGLGTRFTLILPRAKADSRPHNREPGGRQLSGKRVLIVEDQTDILASTIALFESWGCQVVGASSVREALISLPDQPLDLVVSDYHLANQENGLQLLAQLREQHRLDLPAILVSADIHLQLEPNDLMIVVHKPVRPAKLRILAEQLLGHEA